MAALITVLLAAGLAALAVAVKVMRLPAGNRLRYNLTVVPARRVWQWLDQPYGWQVRHFAVAPFGGTLSTWLWTLALDIAGTGTQPPGIWAAMAQMASWGALTYGMFAVGAEGVLQMFYAISKRRRDLNAAADKAHQEGLVEGIQRGRDTVLDELAARLREPGVDPMAAIAELRNGAGQ